MVLGLLLSGNAYAFSLTLPVLECTFDIDEDGGTKTITQIMDLKQLNKKMIKQGYGKLKTTKDFYEFGFVKKSDGVEFFVKGQVNRSTGYFEFTTSDDWVLFFDVDGKQNVNGETIYRKDVLDSIDTKYHGSCKKAENKGL